MVGVEWVIGVVGEYVYCFLCVYCVEIDVGFGVVGYCYVD